MSVKISGLGRGLDSLIPNKKAVVSAPIDAVQKISAATIQELPVDKIVPNPHQPREYFEEVALNELAESIREHGILQPLIVAPAVDGFWQLVAGERRLRAAKIAGLNTVPAIVRDFDEQKKIEVALIENIQRRDLNPMEEAQAYRMLIDQFNLTVEQAAKKVGRGRSTVQNFLRLLHAEPETQEALRKGQINEGHARALISMKREDQISALESAIAGKMTVREIEKIRQVKVYRHQPGRACYDPEVGAMEETLKNFLNTKVDLKKHGSAGQIIIRFFSDEELAEIFKKIVK